MEEVVFELDLEGSVVFEQLEVGFKGILESLKCKQCVLGIYTIR